MDRCCNNCGATATRKTKILNCKHCRMANYCSRACQKADWAMHRPLCRQTGPQYNENGTVRAKHRTPCAGLAKSLTDSFTRLSNRAWLLCRPSQDVYKLLIDSYRLRVTKESSSDTQASSEPDGVKDGLNKFKKYLDRIEAAGDLLPKWWNACKRKRCEKLAASTGQGFNVNKKITTLGVLERYGTRQFIMELRLFDEMVDDRGIGSEGALGTLMAIVALEKGLHRGVDLNQRPTQRQSYTEYRISTDHQSSSEKRGYVIPFTPHLFTWQRDPADSNLAVEPTIYTNIVQAPTQGQFLSYECTKA